MLKQKEPGLGRRVNKLIFAIFLIAMLKDQLAETLDVAFVQLAQSGERLVRQLEVCQSCPQSAQVRMCTTALNGICLATFLSTCVARAKIDVDM